MKVLILLVVCLGWMLGVSPALAQRAAPFEPITVYGEVKKPGAVKYTLGMTVGKALHSAGGLTREAHTGEIEIRRADGGLDVADAERALRGDKVHNLSLLPGDVVLVFRAGLKALDVSNAPKNIDSESAPNPYSRVAVVGQVAEPGPFHFQPVMVQDVLRAAGGFLHDADRKRIVIRRGYLIDPTSSKSFSYDFEAIRAGKAADVLVQPGDVVEVLKKGRKTFFGTVTGSLTRAARYIGNVAKPLIAIRTDP